MKNRDKNKDIFDPAYTLNRVFFDYKHTKLIYLTDFASKFICLRSLLCWPAGNEGLLLQNLVLFQRV